MSSTTPLGHHPFLRVVENQRASRRQSSSKRRLLTKMCADRGVENFRIVSESFESTVGVGVLDSATVYLKSFHLAEKFESELSGLYYLRDANVPQIVDFDRGGLTIVMGGIHGSPLSGTDSVNALFKFIGRMHSIGCATLQAESVTPSKPKLWLENYYRCQRDSPPAEICFSLGDNNLSNFLMDSREEIYRIDLATFDVGTPCCLDILSMMGSLSVEHLLPQSPTTLLNSYMEGRCLGEFATRYESLPDLIRELDVLTSIFDEKNPSFVGHYESLLKFNTPTGEC